MKRPRVLLVDDEPDLLDLLEMDMVRMGLDSERATSVAQARLRLEQGGFDLCLTDMRLSDGLGLDVVRFIAEHAPATPVAVITAYGSAESAVAALKAGAFDYVEKPVTPEKVRSLVRSALKAPEVNVASGGARQLVGDSPPMCQVRALIEKVARSQAPVFITGETGTGKEVAARLIHAHSARAAAPFIAVNCGAIPENLMESEFFGYRKGAFTGAEAERDGFFQAAHGGTLFLDEVADLPLTMQVKLLRAIQEKSVRRVGGVNEEPFDVRVISASHQDLQAAVSTGRFRHDLFYRLNVIEIRMPALRERREDLPELAAFILARLSDNYAGPPPVLQSAALAALARYDYPGNVRELENILERGLALAETNTIATSDLNLEPIEEEALGGQTHQPGLQTYLDELERQAIQEALVKTGHNKTAAARLLGVTFRSLRYRIERLGIE
ncbi:MAG: sigma-54-dependent Fis family transcriptional regulator [Hydrogenophilales bacterium 28-61-23]|nr:MAG: sigma-54-dependent Fis family transcriptional regulator [Hydrogenophilales bacterium 28-61-23]